MKDIYEFAYASRSKLAPRRHRVVLMDAVNAPDTVKMMAVFAANALQMVGGGSVPRDAFVGHDDGRLG